MKTLRFIGMAIIAVIVSVNFAACSSNDDEDNFESSLIGTWIEVDEEEEQRCYTFNSDHTVICWANNYGVEGEKNTLTWSATKTHITLVGGKEGNEPEPYKIEGKNLYFYDGVFKKQ